MMLNHAYVIGEISLPWSRRIVARIAYLLMRLGVPGAVWLYFHCVFGPSVDFEVKEIDVDTPLALRGLEGGRR